MSKSADSFVTLCVFIVALWLGNNAARELERTALETRVSFEGWWPTVERGHVAFPFLSSKECFLPTWKSLDDAQLMHRANSVQRAYTRWCLPVAGKEEQQKLLMGLIEHLRKERGSAPAIHAWDVDVPRNIMLFGDTVMLNPRIIAYGKRDKCLEVRDDGVQEWIPRYLDITLEYTTLFTASTSGTDTMRLVDVEACIAQQLL